MTRADDPRPLLMPDEPERVLLASASLWPMRRVVLLDSVGDRHHRRLEVLECGHTGELRSERGIGPARRRCHACAVVEVRRERGQQ